MAWNLNVVGTPAEVSAAIDALSDDGPFTNSEQMLLVKQVLKSGFDNELGTVGELMYDGPLQLKAHGSFTFTNFNLTFNLSVVQLDQFGKVIGGNPNPINTATVAFSPP